MRSAGADALEFVEGKLVPDYLAKYWTEHSPRATLPSWAACIPEVSDNWIDTLGRWGAKRGLAYVRTHNARVGQMQSIIAKAVRDSAEPHHLLDEDRLMLEMMDFAIRHGAPEQEAADVVEAFLCYDFSFDREGPEVSQVIEGSSDKDETDEIDGGEEDLAELSDGEVDMKKELGRYVVSISEGRGRLGRKCLHRIGSCHRVPGIDFKNYELLGMDFPGAGSFDRLCKDCKLQVPAPAVPSPPSSSSSSSSSSRSSSSSS